VAGPTTLTERVAADIRREGPLRFDGLVERALYDSEGGFFTTAGGAGRSGADFLTSPEVGPLFGAVIAGALDTWWRALGQPDPFVVVEAGAGRGALARSVRVAEPACTAALRYVAVERSDALRAQHEGVAGVESRADLPTERFDGVLLANELLDNLPFRLLEWSGGTWRDVAVGVDDDDRLVETTIDADEATVAIASALVPDPAPGSRIPLQEQATAWLRRALPLVDRGRVVVIDYADVTPSLARRPAGDWLRTYRGHRRGGPPLEALGTQDLTCEVAVDQLAAVEAPTVDRSQAEFLRAHGLSDLVDEGRRVWEERAAVGDLAAMRARSRVGEAEALTDPTGLGAFRVLEWERDATA
jgi:SAM-dependent MidA family methyltransferase